MTIDSVTRKMKQGVESGVFPGAVLLFSVDGDIRYHQSFGVSDYHTRHPVQDDAVFDLASLTKPLATGLGVIKLIEAGGMDFGSTLNDLLSAGTAVPNDKQKITVDCLLRHTSGLPAHRDFFKKILANEYRRPVTAMSENRNQIRQMVLEEPLENVPGAVQTYSDLGYILLAWVVEKTAGQPLDRFVERTVYRPLGIDGLAFRPVGKEENRFTGRQIMPTEACPWRQRVLRGEVHDDNAWICGGVDGHAGLFGDAGSVHALCREILRALKEQSGIIPPVLMRRCCTNPRQLPMVAGFDTPSATGSASGRFFSPESIGHLGFTGTSFWIDPERSVVVVLLTNRVHPVRDNVRIRSFRPEIHDLIIQALV